MGDDAHQKHTHRGKATRAIIGMGNNGIHPYHINRCMGGLSAYTKPLT